MPRKKELELIVTCRVADDEESAKILNIAKNWYVEEFMRWFNNQLKAKEIGV